MTIRNILILSLLGLGTSAMAQDIYNNAELTTTNDLIGTSRFVSMGGAMGALGADISTMGTNPAGTGLYRRSDVAITFGGLWPSSNVVYDNKHGRGTLDQCGMVYSMHLNGDAVKYLNFGANFQKKANYNHSFLADNPNAKNLSQMDQVAILSNGWGTDQYNLSNAAYNSYIMGADAYGYFNGLGAESNQYEQTTSGSLQGYELNLSANVNDRTYIGLGLGIDNVDFSRSTMYTEFRNGSDNSIQDYTLYNDHLISGYGLNVKAGVIFRPIEESPFRVGLSVETPTWYRLQSSTLTSMDTKWGEGGYNTSGYNHYDYEEAFLEYNVTTPWKLRMSLGGTCSNMLAWGVEYEFANYKNTKMGYPRYDEWGGGSSLSNEKDLEMNLENKANLQGMHTLKLGLELNPSDHVSFRAGYNYMTTQFKEGARLNQDIDSYAMDYANSTSYMNLSDTHIIACGLGLHWKHFYADLTYKFRAQSGEFYAFDSKGVTSNADFILDNPGMAGVTLDPVDVSLNRHQITATMGVRF